VESLYADADNLDKVTGYFKTGVRELVGHLPECSQRVTDGA
jgi:hypothetical protein